MLYLLNLLGARLLVISRWHVFILFHYGIFIFGHLLVFDRLLSFPISLSLASPFSRFKHAGVILGLGFITLWVLALGRKYCLLPMALDLVGVKAPFPFVEPLG